jgi:dihydroneopterin aldolase
MKINIKNLYCLADIGIYEYEKVKKTKVLVSLQVFLKEISPIVDYDEIIATVQKIINLKHFDYIEELANEILQAVENISTNISKVEVKVQKCIFGNLVEELSVEV